MQARQNTFQRIQHDSARDAALRIWDRAKHAGRMYHLLRQQSRYEQALKCAEIKESCLRRAIRLLPDEIKVSIDSTYQIGMLSVRWPGHGALHLPADVQLS